jgi:hypothetical protein
LEKLKPEKLSVEYRSGVSPKNPIIPRLYTLTHSDETGQLFLTIGDKYALDKITPKRDEVLAEWIPYQADYVALYANVHVDGKGGPEEAALRNTIFVRELPLAIEAIRYGDNSLFIAHPELDSYPLFIQFNSVYPQFNRVEYWGVLGQYK